MAESMSLRGELRGHTGWVTAIATTEATDDTPAKLLSASRDKTIIVWELQDTDHGDMGDGVVPLAGIPRKCLRGHSHFVEDVVISSDSQYALSASWDKTLRLWDIKSGETTRRFVGHSKDVLSCAFSAENRQIVSGSRDTTVKLWNTLGECKFDITEHGHTKWVSCVRFSPQTLNPLIVSCGWDNLVKVWQLNNCKLICNLQGHTGYLNTVTISPDGSLCASGGKDGTAMLWDLNEGKRLYSLEAEDIIHALVFSPNRYWLCAATSSAVKVWDLETKELVETLEVPVDTSGKGGNQYCVSLCWSADGSNLYAGYTDNIIRVWHVNI